MKRAYTLIEIIIVLAIIAILSLPIFNLSKSYNESISRVKAKGLINEISNFISYSKYYCRYNERIGVIEVNNTNGKVTFKDITHKSSLVKTMLLQDGFKFVSNISLNVNKLGHVESDTIRIMDKEGKIYRITISTGVDTVNIYEGE